MIIARSSRTTRCAFCMKKRIKKQRLKSLFARSSSALSGEVQKILVREVEQKYMTEVQDENRGKFNYYTKCVSDRKIRIENKKLKRFCC